MRARTFSGKHLVAIITFLSDFKALNDAYIIQQGTDMWLFKNYLADPVEAVSKAQVAFRTQTAKSKEGCLASFSTIVKYPLKRSAMDDNITTVDANIRTFKQDSLVATEYAQEVWT